MQLLRLVVMVFLAFAGLTAAASPAEREQAVRVFVDEMVDRHGFDRAALMQLMGKARFQGSIIKAMQRPAEAKPWYQYRPIFVTSTQARPG